MATLIDRLNDLIVRLRTLINERGLPAGGTTGQVLAKTSAMPRDVAWVTPAAGVGGATLSGGAIITVPQGAMEHTQTVAAIGVTSASSIIITLAPHADEDENHELWLDPMVLTGRAAVDEITINAAFSAPTSGPLKLNWSVL